MKRYLAYILSLCLIVEPLNGATLNLADVPLFLTENVAPLTMLVISRDHKLYYEAYNDASDLDGDGLVETRFKPTIEYYGYFDSNKCYSYGSNTFSPVSVTSDGKCAGLWSGNFLNYLTTARLDALRKVLYGGYRATDTTSSTVLRRTYIPQDAHSWGKEYKDIATDGYDIHDYTPYNVPTSGKYHLFANTTLRNSSTGYPLLRVALNQPYRIWEWVSIEQPVAGERAMGGSTGNFIDNITDYVVQVKVCDPTVGLEANCRIYPSGYYKPIGLLQEFGENDSMMFGLITGSYAKNLSGGVLRKNISSITNEINLTSGQFSITNGIISTLNRLTVTGFKTDYNYECGRISNRSITDGECQMWGNPIGEMMYEAVRYFAGKGSPTPAFDYSSGTDTTLILPKPAWRNPYSDYPYCAKGNILVISDIYPSYDSDSVPGSFFNASSGDLTPSLDAAQLGQEIINTEGLSGKEVFIGQVGNTIDGAPTPKAITSFGNIRGLAPIEPNAEGSYYAASVAKYAWLNDVNSIKEKQNIKTFVVGLSSPIPEFTFNVNGHPVTILPFAKSVSGLSITPEKGKFQPTNTLVDYYIESLTPTSAVIRINFEDVQQAADFDMDAIVKYTISVTGDTITVTTDSVSASGGIVQHLGYVVSGTTADGLYLEVRDKDTSEAQDVDYFLDTPPGVQPGGAWEDHTPLPFTNTRVFTASTLPNASVLNSPLWYAAKWGGFEDTNNNAKPDILSEYSNTNTGNPDNYFPVTNANNLKDLLAKAFRSIIDRTGTFSSAGLSSGFLSEETKVYQATFRTKDWSGQLLALGIDINTGDILATGSGPSGSIWEASQQLGLINYDQTRKVITYKPSTKKGIPFRWPANPLSPSNTELDLSQVAALHTNPITASNDSLGNKRLNYIRGDQSQEMQNGGTFRDRTRLLGDIINSSPVVLSVSEQQYPAFWGQNEPENNVSHNTFRANNKNRTPVVYVGANDGMLHAFHASTGQELLAYVPSVLYKKLPQLTNKNYAHQYFVDGSPTVIDTFIGGQWRTILSAGLNGGGQAIYTLDVTDPQQFNEGSAQNIVKWEFTDTDDKDLGFTFSQPSIVRLANGSWGAVFGNGYNNTATDSNISTTGNAVLYIVNIANGQLIKKIDTQVGMAQDPKQAGRPNGLSTPVVVDRDGNGIADFVYAGDLFGNVWKFDISSSNVNQWGSGYESNNKPAPLFVAMDSLGNRQPITSKPAVSRLNANASAFQIYVGTGKYLEGIDKVDKSIQSIYGLRDDGTTPITGRAQLREQTILSEQGSVRVVSSNLLANNDRGWYMDLMVNNNPQGERIISNLIYMNKKIIFTTVIPTDSPCDFGGTSWLMELNAFTGTRLDYNVFDINGDLEFTDADSVTINQNGTDIVVPVSGYKAETGLASSPAILNSGTNEYKYLPGTSGGIQKVNENPGEQQQGRQSWHQLR